MSATPDRGKTNDVFIVAIGGSAGSLTAIIDFFDHTPLDNAAYIVLRHMPREEKSQLGIILQRHSELDIREATENEKVEKNTIYYPPARKHLIIEGEYLKLIDRESSGPNKSIDIFFNSLAGAGHGFRSIGVILSGAGKDGVKGISAIEKAGGLVIAQNPAQSSYGSMPFEAILTGHVHHVALASEIPALIHQYVETHLQKDGQQLS